MGIRTYGYGIITGLQDVSAAGSLDTVGIIGCEILCRDGEGNRLGCACFKLLCLCEINKIYRSLLNAAVGVRRIKVNFYNILAGCAAGIGNLYIEGNVGSVISKVLIASIPCIAGTCTGPSGD